MLYATTDKLSTEFYRAITGSLLIPLALTCGACALNNADPLSRNYTLEIIQTPRAHLSGMNIRSDDEGLILKGYVRNRYERHHPLTGHLDVQIIMPGIAETEFHSLTITRIPPASGHSGAYFNSRLPSIPPAGSTLRVTYHDSPSHEKSEDAADVQQ